MRERMTPRIYKHRELMDEVNDFFIVVKTHFYMENISEELGRRYPKPTLEMVNKIAHDIISALSEQSEEMVKY